MSPAVGPLGRARIGALALAATIIVPVAVNTATHVTLSGLPNTDGDTRFGFASLMLGVAAAASALGVLAVLAFTSASPSSGAQPTKNADARVTLRILAVLRACGDGAAFGVLFAPNLQVWQTSVALTIVEVIFFAALLRFAAQALDEQGAASFARSTRQFVYLYSATRIALLLVWAFPDETVLVMSHRALAPLLDGVVAFVLLRSAGLFMRGGRGESGDSGSPPA